MKVLILLLASFPVYADWYVMEDSPICLTYEALKIAHRQDAGLSLNDYETIKLQNDCSFSNPDFPAMPQAIGVYTKVEMMSYDGKRKVYFVNTRDLKKRL